MTTARKVLDYLAEGKSFHACTLEFNLTIQEVMEIYISSKNNND